jgi:hypothetical protein
VVKFNKKDLKLILKFTNELNHFMGYGYTLRMQSMFVKNCWEEENPTLRIFFIFFFNGAMEWFSST